MELKLNRTHALATSAAVVLGLAACGGVTAQAPDPVSDVAQTAQIETDERAFFEQLLTVPYQSAGAIATAPVDFQATFADLPDGMRLETGMVSFVAASGATRVEDFAIVYDLDGTGVGLEADEVLFYDFDPNAIPDRIQGTNLDDLVKVADRIELRGVRTVGMEAVSRLFLEEYVEALDEFTPMDDEIVTEMTAMDVFNYNFKLQTLIIDGLNLHPFQIAEIELETESAREAEERIGLQMVGAFARSFSLDALAYDGVTFDLAMSDGEIDFTMNGSLGLAGLRGYDRGDLAYSGSWDARFSGDFPFPVDDYSDDEIPTMPMTGSVSVSSISGFEMARAFEALANWEMPDTSLVDFINLGTWEMAGYTADLAGETFFKAERLSLNTDFHWLLPTRINLAIEDSGYDVGNLVQVMAIDMEEEFVPGATPEQIAQGLAIVEQYGFDCLCGDYNIDLSWDEESGAIKYSENSQFAEAFTGSTFVDLTIPTPAVIAELIMSGDAEAQFEAAFKEAFEFREVAVRMTDIGGLANLFEMLHAIGEAFPEQQGMAILAYNDATQLRALAVNSVIGMKPMVRQQAPMADPWMDALANFLKEGGTLNIVAKPPQVIDADFIESQIAEAADPGPEELVEIFGLTVTHTK
ncbi:MAG: hypothetical protein ACX94B_03990 [Henriciella sp.]